VGAFASLATSPAPDNLDSSGIGEGFVLDAEHQAARAAVEFVVNDAARPGEIALSIEADDLWVDTAKRGRLRIVIEREGGGQVSTSWVYVPERRLYTCRGLACSGAWVVSFELPDGFSEGTVHVQWSAGAEARFHDNEIPAGAEIAVTVGGVLGAAGPVKMVQMSTFPAPESIPVVVSNVDISLPNGIGEDRVLTFGRPGAIPSALHPSSVFLQQAGASGRELEPGEGIELRTPDACRQGPCHLDFKVAVSVSSPGVVAQWVNEPWVLDASPPIDGLEVTSEKVQVPAVSAQRRLTPLAVQGTGGLATTGATISLPPVAAGGATPVVFAQVSLADFSTDAPSPNGVSAQVELLQTDRSGEPWTAEARPGAVFGIWPPGAVLAPRCAPERPCTVSLNVSLGISVYTNAPDANVSATPVLRVVLLYPLGVPPDRAKVAIEAA
jgi:hypothetical protein